MFLTLQPACSSHGELAYKHGNQEQERLMDELTELRKRIAELEALEAEREQAWKALRESEERHRLLLESISDGVIVFDREWRIVMLNDAEAHFVQMPKEVLLGSKLTDWRPSIKIEETEFFKAFQRVMETRQPETAVSDYVFLDGRRIWYEMRVYPVPEGILTISTDVTGRVQAEQERERLIEELDAFARSVAHGLKNPLGTILGIAELLIEERAIMSDEELRARLDTMTRTVDRMGKIIDELLLLADVRKAGEVEIRPLDMAGIVAGAQERLAYTIEKLQAKITLPDTWPVALGHGAWVEEVWVNYLSNALQHGGQPPRIELGATVQAGMVRFWVRDNGPGIAPEDQTRLFTPFTQLAQVHAKGHGLGLSIVRRIVERLGGEVGVESELGRGSVFYFTLPGG
jgi:PAS domain S-box-containing protein